MNTQELAEKLICYNFKDKQLLKQALTHPSIDGNSNYQRLEFLGDSLLDFFIAEVFYAKIPNAREGELTKLRSAVVMEESIGEALIESGLDKCVITKKNAEGISVYADVFEAVIAALYLDGGIDVAKEFTLKHLQFQIGEAGNKSKDDYKSKLFEYRAKTKKDINFVVLSESGEAHKPTFIVDIIENGKSKECVANGSSKKEAEQEAAKIYLNKYVNK